MMRRRSSKPWSNTIKTTAPDTKPNLERAKERFPQIFPHPSLKALGAMPWLPRFPLRNSSIRRKEDENLLRAISGWLCEPRLNGLSTCKRFLPFIPCGGKLLASHNT